MGEDFSGVSAVSRRMKRKCVRTPCESVTIYIGQKRARRPSTQCSTSDGPSPTCAPAGRGRQAQELAEVPARAARTARPLPGRLLARCQPRAHGFAAGDDGRMAANIGRRARSVRTYYGPAPLPVSVQSTAQAPEPDCARRVWRWGRVASGGQQAGRCVHACMETCVLVSRKAVHQ